MADIYQPQHCRNSWYCFYLVSLCVCYSKSALQNVILPTPTVGGHTTKAVLTILTDVYMYFCRKDVVTKLHTCVVVVVKMKTDFDDRCDLSKGVGSREEAITPLAYIHFRWWMAVFPQD